ncbi:hypothetical protein V2I01_10285 [Micromonospora sp. BRA006-A]|nr:hypothetical protein [Micromonospora sp. BRA006-A]
MPLMRASTLRAAGLVTVVLAGLLGSAFVLGRSLVPDPHPSAAGVATTLTGPRLRRAATQHRLPRQHDQPRPSPDAAPDAVPSRPTATARTAPCSPPARPGSR